MKENLHKIAALICALILLVTCSACAVQVVKIQPDEPVPTNVPVNDGHDEVPEEIPDVTAEPQPDDLSEEEPAEHGLVCFDDMEYVHPDFDAVKAHICEIEDMVDAGADVGEVNKSYDELQNEFIDFYTQYLLLTIHCSIDISDKKLVQEKSELSEEYYSLVALSRALNQKINRSQYRDVIFADWTDKELERLEITSRLSDDEYVELSTRAEEIGTEYWDIINNTTVGVVGSEYTAATLPESGLPREIQLSLLERCYQKMNDKLGELYLELIDINKRIAEKAGFDSYPEYAYAIEYSRDYTVEDTDRLCEYVREHVPEQLEKLVGSLSGDEYESFYAASVVPEQLKQRQDIIESYTREISPQMHEAFQYLIDYRLSVITDSDVCEGGAYTVFLEAFNSPVMYINLMDGYQDVLTFIHEFGHFYGFYENGAENNNYGSLDVLEIMSQAGELLFMPYFEQYMDEDAFSAMKKYQMFNTLYCIIDSCVYDEFQRYVYTNDVDDVEDINEAFADISRSYGIDESYYSVPLEYMWIDVPHNFSSPFYYISYTTSLIPAVEIFDLSNRDRSSAIELYNAVVHSESRDSFLQVLEQAGLASPFEEETIINVAAAINDYLN